MPDSSLGLVVVGTEMLARSAKTIIHRRRLGFANNVDKS